MGPNSVRSDFCFEAITFAVLWRTSRQVWSHYKPTETSIPSFEEITTQLLDLSSWFLFFPSSMELIELPEVMVKFSFGLVYGLQRMLGRRVKN